MLWNGFTFLMVPWVVLLLVFLRSLLHFSCNICNQFKSATLLSATHECTPKIWANHERHSFQNWRVKIERHSFLGVSEVKECTLSKSPRIYEILTQILIFFALRTKWNVFNILLLLIIASSVFEQQILLQNRQFKHHIQCTLSLCFTFF